jgi:hypothetical protein
LVRDNATPLVEHSGSAYASHGATKRRSASGAAAGSADAIKLHLGAFDQSVPGWVNTDVTPHIWISRVPLAAFALFKMGKMSAHRYQQHCRGVFRSLKYMELTRPLPYADDSVSAIFSSHVFEHLFLDEVIPLIGECFRVLAKGGVCRVVVPDLEKIVADFDARDPTRFLMDIYEVGTRSAVKNSHHCGYTGQSLSDLFEKAGFEHCRVVSFRVGDCPDIDTLDNRPESLFFEAKK